MSLSDPDAHTRVPTFTAESPWPGPVLDSCCPALPLRKALKLVASLFAEAGAVLRKLLKLDPLVLPLGCCCFVVLCGAAAATVGSLKKLLMLRDGDCFWLPSFNVK